MSASRAGAQFQWQASTKVDLTSLWSAIQTAIGAVGAVIKVVGAL